MSWTARSHKRGKDRKFLDPKVERTRIDCQRAVKVVAKDGTVSYTHDGRTEQCHKDECDIHRIVDRAMKEGIIDHLGEYRGTYGDDYLGVPDYQTAANLITNTESLFNSLPSKVRNQFQNNAASFISFMRDEKNRDAITELGLDTSHLPPLPADPPAPMKVQVVPTEGSNESTGGDPASS